MSINVPLGTYVSDGLRSGPFYSGQLPHGFVANNDGIITSGSHSQYGPGVLYSPQNTYNITPASPQGAGVDIENNLVAKTAVGAVPGAMDLTLRGDNSVTFQNAGVVQFDWPRVVTVRISDANATKDTRVTIFGEDWYGMPMQHTYVLDDAPAIYPVIDINAHTVSIPTKAFYRVNRVHISAALPGNCAISLGAADAFGLPYAVPAFDMTAVRWGAASEFTTAGGAGAQFILNGAFVPADVTPTATAETGDVRGFYAPSVAANGVRSLSFTSVIPGANVWTNQVANMQQLYMQRTGSPTPQGVPVAPLTPAALYGVPQFYTGLPS